MSEPQPQPQHPRIHAWSLMVQAGIDGQVATEALQALVAHVKTNDAALLIHWTKGFGTSSVQQALRSIVQEGAQRINPPTAATFYKPDTKDGCGCYPHGSDGPCTCTGCAFCVGHEIGCTCDIAWDCEHKES